MRHLLLFCFCTGLLSLAVHPLPAQTPEWALYTSTSDIRDIAQEGDALWLATSTGLVHIDRHSGATKTFYHKTNSGLPAAALTAVAIDHNGVKWIGTNRGVVRYDNSSWKVFSTENAPLTSNSILDITVDRNNTVWVSTRYEVVCFSEGVWRVFDDISLSSIEDMCEAPTGDFMVFAQACLPANCGTGYRSRDLATAEPFGIYGAVNSTNVIGVAATGNDIWFASNFTPSPNFPTSKLVRYRGSDTLVITAKEFGTKNPDACTLTAFSIDSSGRLWIADAMSRGIVVLDGDKRHVVDSTEFPAAAYNQVNTITTDSDGNVWIGTKRNGLLRYSGTTWTHYPFFGLHPSFAPPDFPIKALCADSNQHIWIGAQLSKEITELAGAQLHFHTLPGNAYISSMKIDSKGTMWLVSGGLYSRAVGDTAWRNMDCPNALLIFIDKNDGVWVSSYLSVSKFDSKGRTDYTSQNSELEGSCVGITEDRNGVIWFRTTLDLVGFDGVNWKHVAYDPAINSNSGTTLLVCDSSNNLWMVGNNWDRNTLAKFDGKEWTTFDRLSDAAFIEPIRDMLIDREGTLWVATYEDVRSPAALKFDIIKGGLIRYKNGNLDMLTSDNSPLISNGTSALAVDKFNTLWIGTVSGLQAYREGGITTSAPEPAVASGNNALRNYPNPASALTTISYSVPGEAAQLVHIALYNSLGVQVAQLVHSVQPAGDYSVEFDTGTLPPGVYYCQLHTGSTTAGRQIVVVR